MENPEEILHSLEEFAKMKPKDIPRELEEYLKFVAKTGDPIYQWSAIKSLFREKLISVITEFYESCTSMEIPPCPNVELFNYDLMKNFILEKLDTFSSAPFTLQRICELLTSPRKEYTRIDKYMRALEKNILVVSTMEPGGRRTENGEGIMNGIESDHDHVPEPGNEINVEEMDDSPSWPQNVQAANHITEQISFDNPKTGSHVEIDTSIDTYTNEKITSEASTSSQEIVCVQYVSIEPLSSENLQHQNETEKEDNVSVTITAVNIERVDENRVESQLEESKVQESEISTKQDDIHVSSLNNKLESETDSEIKTVIQTAESTPSETVESDSCAVNIGSSENIPSTFKSDQEAKKSFESKNNEIKNISLETNVTCSENISDNSRISSEMSNEEEEDLNKDSSNLIEHKLDAPESCNKKFVEEERLGTVDSTTTSEVEVMTKNIEDTEEQHPSNDIGLIPVESSGLQVEQKSEADSSTVCSDTVDVEHERSENENVCQVIEPNNTIEQDEIGESSELKTEEIPALLEAQQQIPMEVDKNVSEKQEFILNEAETSKPTV